MFILPSCIIPVIVSSGIIFYKNKIVVKKPKKRRIVLVSKEKKAQSDFVVIRQSNHTVEKMFTVFFLTFPAKEVIRCGNCELQNKFRKHVIIFDTIVILF